MKTIVNTTDHRGAHLIDWIVATTALISLISIIFVGARAWKKSVEKVTCIKNIIEVQKNLRAWQHFNDKKTGDSIEWEKIIGPGQLMEYKDCPSGSKYTFKNTVPSKGNLACSCDHHDHTPSESSDW